MLSEFDYDFETVQDFVHKEHFIKGRNLLNILKQIEITPEAYQNACVIYSSYII